MQIRERSIGAHKAVVDAMGEVAWPTIMMAGALISAYVATLLAVGLGVVPLWIAFLVAAGIVYAVYTVVHEAVHGSISGKTRSLFWLNEALGYIGGQIIGAPLTAHRKEHIDHHRYTNVDHQDPDLKLVGGSLLTVVQGVFRVLPLQLQHYAQRHWVQASRKDRAVLFVEVFFIIAWRLLFIAWVGWTTGLVLLVAANLLGIFITLVLFAWIVHLPHAAVGRYRDTSTFIFPGVVDDVVSALWLFQNYHSVHHLYPRVPFYRYRQVFRGIEGDMQEHDAPIMRIGQRA